MAGKLPYMQFYPGDWQKDPALRAVSHACKGVYMDVLCLMWECEERGVLATAGKAWSEERIARAVGGDFNESLSCITELIECGVVSRRQSSGAIYSRRMVRDEESRRKHAARMRKSRINANCECEECDTDVAPELRSCAVYVDDSASLNPDVPEGNSEGEQPTRPAGEDTVQSGATVPETMADRVEAVCAHYQDYHPRARPGRKERAKIQDRLREGYSVADLKQAIDGNHKSPYHCGENDGGVVYHNLELVVRDSSHVVQFIDLDKSSGGPVLSEKNRRAARAVQSTVAAMLKVEEEFANNHASN